jgi:hypothetical protein
MARVAVPRAYRFAQPSAAISIIPLLQPVFMSLITERVYDP